MHARELSYRDVRVNMEVSAIPVPRVPSPPISAPPSAKNPQHAVPPTVPPAPEEGRFEEWLDRLPNLIPPWASESMWSVVKTMNRVVFKSKPPGTPVPTQSGSWKFDVIGDYGGGHRPLTDVTGNIARSAPDLVLATGDNVYYNGTEAEYRKKWDPPNMFGDIRTNFPVMPTLGNHDTRKSTAPFFKRFPELDTARYYSYDHKGVHFVSLNSNESLEPGSPQLTWLDKDLAASTSDWKVMSFHHPMHSGYPKSSGPLGEYLAPLIAKHGVDLVFTGHEHNYSRSKPINSGGTLEIITGNGGHTLHPFVTPQSPAVAYRDVDFGHVEIEVRGNELVGRYVVRDGSTRDTFVIPNLTPGVRSDASAGAAAIGAASA